MLYHATPAGADKASGNASFAGANTVVTVDFAGKKGILSSVDRVAILAPLAR
jgi:hypothetical protein